MPVLAMGTVYVQPEPEKPSEKHHDIRGLIHICFRLLNRTDRDVANLFNFQPQSPPYSRLTG